MPELPEVETTMRGLAPFVVGQRLVLARAYRPNLRFAIPDDFQQAMQGQIVERLERRAKYLLWHLSNQRVLLMHLGMSGRLRINPNEPLAKHDHLQWQTEAGADIRFYDPRRFGFVDLLDADARDSHRALAPLGPEPMSEAFNAEGLAAAIANRKAPIKSLLLDQRIVAGLGNIYVCEALFMARIHPSRSGASLDKRDYQRLWAALRDVLAKAIAAGGSSLRDFRQVDGNLGYFAHQWQVYGREDQACPRCQTPIVRLQQSGRSSFVCPACQS